MWLIIRKKDRAVVGTNYSIVKPPYNSDVFYAVEWHGTEPLLHNPDEGVASYDPTAGLEPDDPRLRSEMDEMDVLKEQIAELRVRIAAVEERSVSR